MKTTHENPTADILLNDERLSSSSLTLHEAKICFCHSIEHCTKGHVDSAIKQQKEIKGI